MANFVDGKISFLLALIYFPKKQIPDVERWKPANRSVLQQPGHHDGPLKL